MADYKGAVEKVDAENAEIAEMERHAAEIEAELQAAEKRIYSAEVRYQLACRQVAAELAKPLFEPEVKPKSQPAEIGLAEMEAHIPTDDIVAPPRAAAGAKNTSARSRKELKREQWLANRAAETRVRDKAKKAREILRRDRRDKRMQFHQAEVEEAAAPSPAPAKPVEKSESPTPLFETEDVKQGAKGIADRVASLKDLNDVDKRAALLRVLAGGRENYYIAEPQQVLDDLDKGGLVDAQCVATLRELLKTDIQKGTPLGPSEWLAHAQKMSGVDRRDLKPFNDNENQYLKWVDKKNLATAETELDAAEADLEELLKTVDACLPILEGEEATQVLATEQELDEEYAEYLAAANELEKESKGLKNTSALSEKVVSKEKWLVERGREKRAFDKNKKHVDQKRAAARDRKAGSVEMPDDA